jgi:hypothetical protein
MTVPVTVVGDGPLADWHRQVFARHPACSLLAEGLPDRAGFVDLCGPPAVCSSAIGAAVRERVPLVLSLPIQWSAEELLRLTKAIRRKPLPVAALGSLRVFPAAARLKEIISSGVLGNLLSVEIERQGTDTRPGSGEPDSALSRWRDADLCLWLAAGQPEAKCQQETGGEDGPAERRVRVLGALGELDLRFAAGQTPELTVRFGERRSTRRVPPLGNDTAHLAELSMLVAARQYGHPWLLLPTLDDAVAAGGTR